MSQARFVAIHGHFYQPPRESPWLERIEAQDSAAPYHDWNARVTAECYAPNTAARRVDTQSRILDVVDNFAALAFDVGPTLMTWLEQERPDVYGAILEADRASRAARGHGNAIAQAYGHAILPLCTRRDKVTQVRWGLADFRHRFGRDAAGMWLPETAADRETLEVLAEEGVRFTLLAPGQAASVRGRTQTGGPGPRRSIRAGRTAGREGRAGPSRSSSTTERSPTPSPSTDSFARVMRWRRASWPASTRAHTLSSFRSRPTARATATTTASGRWRWRRPAPGSRRAAPRA